MTDKEQPKRHTDLTKANQVRMRAAEEKKAAVLRERGWVCIPPDEVDDLPTEK